MIFFCEIPIVFCLFGYGSKLATPTVRCSKNRLGSHPWPALKTFDSQLMAEFYALG